MSLKGNLSSINLAEIIQLIGLGEKSGCLRIQSKNDTAFVFFEKGLLTYAYTKSSPINLSKILVNKNILTKDKAEKLITYSKEKSMDPNEIIVKGNLLSKDKLQDIIKNIILNGVYDLFKWKEGEFEFEDNKKAEKPILLINSNFNNIIMEGSRRVDEIEFIKKTIPSDKTRLILSVNGIKKIHEINLKPIEKKMLLNFNKITDIYHISLAIEEIDEFDLYKHVYGFVQSKLVEVLTEENYDTIQDHVDLATFYIERENFKAALHEVSRAVLLAPFDENIISLLHLSLKQQILDKNVIEYLKYPLLLKNIVSYNKDIIEFLEKLVSRKQEEKLSPLEVLKQGTLLLKNGKYKEAVELMTKNGPIKNKNYYLLLGNCYIKTNDFQGAYETYTKYLDYDKDNPKIKKLIEVIKQRI